MAFHEVRFPDKISRGARGGPERRTQIVELASGDEERNASWANSRRRYDVAYGIRRADDLAAVVAFFEARNGRLHGFRFKDWGDHKSCLPSGTPAPTDQAIGTGDGMTTAFQLVKRYASGAQSWTRAIAKPVSGSVRIALSGVEQLSGWSVDTATGVVTFSAAPGAGVAITAGLEFDVPVRFTSATEGAVIPRLYGRMRMGGNIIWATDFREETKTTTQGGGKGGGGGKVKTTEYLYYASFAVALCEGPITGIGRIWADGKPMDISGVTWRWYPGDEAQAADPFISAKMGAASTPAYRGTVYVVFEELALSTYGNRLPQLSFEVFRPLADPDTAEGLTRAVTMIPASGEFTYATQAIRKTDGGATQAENLSALADSADMVEALDRLQAMAPAVESVSLVVAWFGDDLRAGSLVARGFATRDIAGTLEVSPRTVESHRAAIGAKLGKL